MSGTTSSFLAVTQGPRDVLWRLYRAVELGGYPGERAARETRELRHPLQRGTTQQGGLRRARSDWPRPAPAIEHVGLRRDAC